MAYATAYDDYDYVLLVHHYFVSTGVIFPLQLHISHLRTMPRENYSHWGPIFTSTTAGPMFAANFCPSGTEVGRSETSRPLARKSIFVSGGGRLSLRSRRAKVEAITEMVPQWDTIFSVIDYCARSSRCRNFCATGTQVNNAAPVRSNK